MLVHRYNMRSSWHFPVQSQALVCIKQWSVCARMGNKSLLHSWYSPAFVFLTCPSSALFPALSVLIQNPVSFFWGVAAGSAVSPYWGMSWCGTCRGATNHGSMCCSGGKCPIDLQHFLDLFLSCPPFWVLLNLLGQPRALCCKRTTLTPQDVRCKGKRALFWESQFI